MTGPIAWSRRATTRAVSLAICLGASVVLTASSACAPAVRLKAPDWNGPESLEFYIERVRALSVAAKTRSSTSSPVEQTAPGAGAGAARPPLSGVQTVEQWDPALAIALAVLAASPSAAQHRMVALEYRRLGILDRAHAHLNSALRLNPRDAAAFDARARIWRDWGFPHVGLGDAYRAVEFAPDSASAANTLGTLLQAVGRVQDARRWYNRALSLDSTAAYAQNNICYSAIVLILADTLTACQKAVAMSPQLKDAHNNLALAYAATGNFERARKELELSGPAAAAQYNAGILYLADRQYSKAAAAFDAAVRLSPKFELAVARRRQARMAADAGE